MAHIDVFNGDADGICALIQIQLNRGQGGEARLITGVKRDTALLQRALSEGAGEGDIVTVLDISLKKNHRALAELLRAGANILYIDHHEAPPTEPHPRLTLKIDTSLAVCTSSLAHDHTAAKFPLWAAVGAYGDNQPHTAQELLKTTKTTPQERNFLQNLGICINYNAYGECVQDLHFPPDQLFRQLRQYQNPLALQNAPDSPYARLQEGYDSDIAHLKDIRPEHTDPTGDIYLLPNQPWAVRASGVFANQLTNQNPQKAHAVVTETDQGDYRVSVRAPKDGKLKASDLCDPKHFPTAGGRAAAAGINHLPKADLPKFTTRFHAWSRGEN